MAMKLAELKIVPIIKGLGFINTSGTKELGKIWKKVINEKPYIIDFGKNQICRMDDFTRIDVDPEDEDLKYVKDVCMSAMFPPGSDCESIPEEHTAEDIHGPVDDEPEVEACKEVAQSTKETEPRPPQNKTGSKTLDLIHKIVGNDVLEIFGDTGTGKSKFVMHVAQEAIKTGKKVYYLDTERNLTADDIKDLVGCEYKYTPELSEIKTLVKRLPKADVIIIDSIGFPILTEFATMSLKERGDALLDMIAIFGALKKWAYHNNGIAVVTNQPESEFNKSKDHILRPFGDKSQFAAKEIWKTEFVKRSSSETRSQIIAFRSRSAGYQTKLAVMSITSTGVVIE